MIEKEKDWEPLLKTPSSDIYRRNNEEFLIVSTKTVESKEITITYQAQGGIRKETISGQDKESLDLKSFGINKT